MKCIWRYWKLVCGFLQLPLKLLKFFLDKDVVNFCTEHISLNLMLRGHKWVVFKLIQLSFILFIQRNDKKHFLAMEMCVIPWNCI